MSQSIFDKLRTIGLSTVHSLLDGVQDLNTIGGYEQYLRDLEQGRNQLDDQAASERARLKYLDGQIATLQARIDEDNENILTLLSDDDPNNDHFAVKLQVGVDNHQKSINSAKAEQAEVQDRINQYTEAVNRLDMRLVEAQGKLEELRNLDRQASASAGVAKALNRINVGSTPDTSRAEERLRQQAAVGANQVQRGLNRITGATGGPSVDEAAAQAKIARIKAAIAAKKTGTTG